MAHRFPKIEVESRYLGLSQGISWYLLAFKDSKELDSGSSFTSRTLFSQSAVISPKPSVSRQKVHRNGV